QKLFDILNKALEKDPDRRYQSCGEMQADLEDCIYQLCNRPLTTRGISEYMSRLFKEEIAAEERAMREVLQVHAPEERQAEPGPPRPEPQPEPKLQAQPQPEPERIVQPKAEPEPSRPARKPEKMEVASPAPETKERRRGILYGAFAAVLGVLVLVFALTTREKPAPDGAPGAVPEEKKVSETESIPEVEAAVSALRKDRFSEAVKLFEKSLAKNPGLKDKIGRSYSQALQGLALSVVDKNQQKAKSLLLKAVEYDPGSVQGNFQLGLLYVRFKDHKKAIAVYEKVTRLDPRFADAFFNLGYAYAVTRDYQKAEAMYTRVAELRPSYVDEAFFNLAMIQEKLGKKAQCLASLEKAVKFNPKNTDAQQRLQRLRGK
ncbi:MAG: tetratricopeptide repeat protein, partial [Pseudomonadota bacterium]